VLQNPVGTRKSSENLTVFGSVKVSFFADEHNGFRCQCGLRETKFAYETNPAYINLNLVRLPLETKVLDGAGNIASDTKYYYDQGNVANCPNILGHDNTNYVGPTTRGNATTISQYVNSTKSWVSTTLVYDIAGNIAQLTDSNGNKTTTSFIDAYGTGSENSYALMTTLTNPKGQAQTWAYDYGVGQPLSATNVNGGVTTYAYDEMNRVVRSVLPNGAVLNYSYPNSTEVDLKQDQSTANDQVLHTQTLADGFGRVTTSNVYESASQAISNSQGYDAMGRIASTTDPLGNVTTYGYDSLSRQTSVTTADTAVATTSYSGNTTTVKDQAGKTRALTYDGLGRLWNVREDPSNKYDDFTTDYRYTATTMTVSQGYCPTCQTRTFANDTLGRQVSATNPESGTVSYTYDAVGNVLTRTDARGIVTSYAYDVLNRPTAVSYSDGTPSFSYDYDVIANGVGQLSSIANSNSIFSFNAFDVMQNVTQSSQTMAGQTFTFQYAYNLTGALTSETFPSSRVVTTAYDGANRPVTLSGTYSIWSANYVTGTSYLANGGITSLTRGNNLIYGESYNSRGQLTGITEKLNGANVWTLGLNWGTASTNNGTLQGATSTGGGLTFGQTFGYDNLNRLSTAGEGSNWAQSYSHDAWGNQWMPTSSLPAPVTGPSMPTANVYSASGAGDNRNVNSTYDAAGNLTVFGSVSVSYDAENRQKAAGSTIYLYDGVGQRLGKTATGSTEYVYDAFGQLGKR